ncbi:MAG: hypothetical protein HKM94_09425, partial [Halobacteria archaeon]|nr:hypothetical protein [Halobacteria archaeon]
IQRHEVIGGVVVRIPRAYPLFELGYREHHDRIAEYLGRFRNLHLIGRAGKFKYYNMDHAMESGLAVAARLVDRMLDVRQAARKRLAATGTDA